MSTITIQIDYYDCAYGSCSSQLKRSEQFTGTLEDAFKAVEKRNESLRYCNGCYYKFADKNINDAYNKWRKGLSYGAWLDVVGATIANTD